MTLRRTVLTLAAPLVSFALIGCNPPIDEKKGDTPAPAPADTKAPEAAPTATPAPADAKPAMEGPATTPAPAETKPATDAPAPAEKPEEKKP